MKKTLPILYLIFVSIFTYAQPDAFSGLITTSNETALVYGDMTIFGNPGETGDWVAAFDEQDNLVGVAQTTVFQNQAIFLITLYGGANQLTNGEMFKLRGYDSSTSTYYTEGDPEVEFGPWFPQTGGGYLPGYQVGGDGLPIFNVNFDNILPIELSEFGVQKRSCENFTLKWITQTEINNEYFSIERSIDDIYSFETIAKVDGAGNSNSARTYTYEDVVRLEGNHTVYYRLKQTDFDGRSSYSNTILTKLDCNSNGKLSVYPNPFRSVININTEAEDSRIIVINTQGQLVHDSSLTSSNSSAISTADWPSGLYYARNIVNGEVVDAQKIMKHD